MKKACVLLLFLSLGMNTMAQDPVDESQLGAWYMYFFTKKFENSKFGIQGDYQYRAWNGISDKEQLLLRTGLTYRPNDQILFTAGYAYISSGAFGDADVTLVENRIYQEALIPQKIGSRFYLTHRMRFEQRWVENQDFRTRFRYNLFLNVPLNSDRLGKNAVYLALYNEIFINGEQEFGQGRSVEWFDRNRTYLGLGYGLRDNLRLQSGWMNQTTNDWVKGQLQFSLHHNF